MANTWKERIRDRRFLLIAAGVIVVLAVVVAATIFLRRRPHDVEVQGATFPALVDTAASSGVVSVASAGYWGGGLAESSGEQLLIRLSEGQAGQQATESLPRPRASPCPTRRSPPSWPACPS